MTKREKIGVARSISPFLVIDDNTIKASIIFAKIDKFNRLIPIETTYTCLDAYHHPMMTWPSPKTMISPFVPPLLMMHRYKASVQPMITASAVRSSTGYFGL